MAKEEKGEEKKIIIDEDWKQQAGKEKEKVEQDNTGPQKDDRGPLPKGDFVALISMLATQGFYALGLLKVEGQEKAPDLELARYSIDMLEVLEEKTKGNLSEEEANVLKNTLGQLRMAFVEVSNGK